MGGPGSDAVSLEMVPSSDHRFVSYTKNLERFRDSKCVWPVLLLISVVVLFCLQIYYTLYHTNMCLEGHSIVDSFFFNPFQIIISLTLKAPTQQKLSAFLVC